MTTTTTQPTGYHSDFDFEADDEIVDSYGFGGLRSAIDRGDLSPTAVSADGVTTYGELTDAYEAALATREPVATAPTYSDILDRHKVEIPPHLEAQAEVPVHTGPQRQGDIIVLPARAGLDIGNQVPAEGVAVVRGEAGGNTHLLVADGQVSWRATSGGDPLELGVVTVADGSTAYLLHPEHGGQGIGPGSYRIRRQREQADEIRMVQD